MNANCRYFHVDIFEEDQDLSRFYADQGLRQVIRMPFGLNKGAMGDSTSNWFAIDESQGTIFPCPIQTIIS